MNFEGKAFQGYSINRRFDEAGALPRLCSRCMACSIILSYEEKGTATRAQIACIKVDLTEFSRITLIEGVSGDWCFSPKETHF